MPASKEIIVKISAIPENQWPVGTTVVVGNFAEITDSAELIGMLSAEYPDKTINEQWIVDRLNSAIDLKCRTYIKATVDLKAVVLAKKRNSDSIKYLNSIEAMETAGLEHNVAVTIALQNEKDIVTRKLVFDSFEE